MISKVIKAYLRYLGLKPEFPILFVTTNDLAQMSFCPNKVYIQINFVGGMTYYSESILEAMRSPSGRGEEKVKTNELINEILRKEQFKKWEIGEKTVKSYLCEEMWAFSHVENGLELLPKETSNIRVEASLPDPIKKQIECGIFHSLFRTNFGCAPFFLSSVPDIVILRESKIRGIIEMKSSRRVNQIFPSEHDQIEFYRLYVHRRKLPLLPDAFFVTIKYNRLENPDFEKQVVNFVHKDMSIGDLARFVGENNGLLKESTCSLTEIENKLRERIRILSSPKYPVVTECPWKQCHFAWFDRTKRVEI